MSNYNKVKLKNIKNIPAISPKIEICSFPKVREAGNNSSSDIQTINPPTIANITPNKKSLTNGKRIKPKISAPIGSLIPEKNDQKKAFFLLLVEVYIGIATAIPSGMLWSAIANANKNPSSTSFNVPAKVTIPSGKL